MRLLIQGFLFLILANPVHASFTIDQVMSAPFASSPIAAPTGAEVAWLLNQNGQRNIWVASAPDWKGRKVTAFNEDDGQEIAELAWSPDGKCIFFARGGDFDMGRSNPNPATQLQIPEQDIWRVAMDGSPAQKLTTGHAPAVSPKGDLVAFLRNGQVFTMKPDGTNVISAATVKGSVEDLKWSPDGNSLAFTNARGDHGFIGIYKPQEKVLSYVDPSVDHDVAPEWSPDSKQIAFLRIPAMTRAFAFGPERTGQPWSIRIADARTGMGHEVFRALTGLGSVFHGIVGEDQIMWTAANKLIFPWERTGWNHLYSVSASGGDAMELTPGTGIVEHVSLSQDRRTIYYSSNIGDIDRRHLWKLSASGEEPGEITRGENIEWEPTPAANNSALVFLTSSYNEKSHAAVREANGTTKALAPDTIASEFPAAQLVRPQPVLITAADGLVIHGQLFLPADETRSERHPALVFFHGGSRRQMLLGFHYMYYYSNAYALNQYFVNHGYIVLSVNYRSGIGYGLDFREALHYGATGASEYNDVIGAGLYLKSRADVDPKRIGVWGGSYGGYLTALALARASDLFSAGVDFHGVHDWNLEIRNFAPAYDPQVEVDAARIAWESSPMSSVSSWKSPVLLIQGDDDRNVQFSQSVRLAEALRKQHVYFEQLIIPNEVHDFLMQRHWVEAYKATADFFDRKLVNR